MNVYFFMENTSEYVSETDSRVNSNYERSPGPESQGKTTTLKYFEHFTTPDGVISPQWVKSFWKACGSHKNMCVLFLRFRHKDSSGTWNASSRNLMNRLSYKAHNMATHCTTTQGAIDSTVMELNHFCQDSPTWASFVPRVNLCVQLEIERQINLMAILKVLTWCHYYNDCIGQSHNYLASFFHN